MRHMGSDYSDSMFKRELGLVCEKDIRVNARRKERTDRKI